MSTPPFSGKVSAVQRFFQHRERRRRPRNDSEAGEPADVGGQSLSETGIGPRAWHAVSSLLAVLSGLVYYFFVSNENEATIDFSSKGITVRLPWGDSPSEGRSKNSGEEEETNGEREGQ